jgi:hypothetical protein
MALATELAFQTTDALGRSLPPHPAKAPIQVGVQGVAATYHLLTPTLAVFVTVRLAIAAVTMLVPRIRVE